MGRKAGPIASPFGRFLRERREELELSKAAIAKLLGFSTGFWEVLETGRRGCNLEDLPRIADALRTDPRGLAQLYFLERMPRLYRVLFGEEPPRVDASATSTYLEDTHWRLDQLRPRERGVVDAMVSLLYDRVRH